MSESFEDAMDYADAVVADCDIPLLDRLKRAHEHDMEHLRKEIAARYELTHCPACEARLKGLDAQHDIEHIRKAEYHRGFEDGKKSKDAGHAAVAMRLRWLSFDGDSHDNLSKIAYAIYPCATGWTCESCEGLRDKIIDLLGGVHDDPVPVVADRDACGDGCDRRDGEAWRVTYDVLGNERHKAICELRKMTIDSDYHGNYQRIALAIGTVYDGESFASECVRDRLIHLLGGDQPSGIDVLNGADLSKKSVDAMDKRAKEAYIEHKDDCLTLRDGLGGEIKLVKGDVIINGESLIESLVKNTEELSRQGKVRFPPNAEGSLGSLKTVEETAALIDEVKRRADQSHESSPMRQENETGISDRTDEPNFTEITKTINLDGKRDSELMENGENHKIATIADELRECVNAATKTYDDTPWHEMGEDSEADHTICLVTEGELLRIADRIDEWFKRLCEQHEAVLQKTIDEMAEFREHDAEYASTERDELQKMLDEMQEQREHWADEATKMYRLFFSHDEYCVPNNPSEMVAAAVRTLQAKLDAIREAFDGQR